MNTKLFIGHVFNGEKQVMAMVWTEHSLLKHANRLIYSMRLH